MLLVLAFGGSAKVAPPPEPLGSSMRTLEYAHAWPDKTDAALKERSRQWSAEEPSGQQRQIQKDLPEAENPASEGHCRSLCRDALNEVAERSIIINGHA
eukprot:2507202-Amphidinium_carterae.1